MIGSLNKVKCAGIWFSNTFNDSIGDVTMSAWCYINLVRANLHEINLKNTYFSNTFQKYVVRKILKYEW